MILLMTKTIDKKIIKEKKCHKFHERNQRKYE